MRLKRGLKGSLLTLLAIALVLLGFWIYIGIRLSIWKYSEYVRYNWLTANLPIVRELWHGDIKAGENVEQLISRWQPHRIVRFGPWTRLEWYPGGPPRGYISLIGIIVLAKDGTLVEACSYSDDLVCARTFFNTMKPEGEREYRAALEAYVKDLRAKAQRERELNTTNGPSGLR